MKSRTLLVIILLISVFTLSSCLSYNTYIYAENVCWKTENDRLSIFIEGPNNNHSGLAKIKINDEYIDTYVEFGGNVPLLTLYLEDNVENMSRIEEYSFIHFRMHIIDKTTVELEVEYNNSNDSYYDNLSFTIYRSDLSEDKLNAMYYIDTSFFHNSDYEITIGQDKYTIFSGKAEGMINYQDQTISIEFVYVNTTYFEIYDVVTQDILLSGTYDTGINSMTLDIQDNTIFDENVVTIELSILESN